MWQFLQLERCGLNQREGNFHDLKRVKILIRLYCRKIPTIWKIWIELNCRKIPTIWKQWIQKFWFGLGLNQIVGKFIRFENNEIFYVDGPNRSGNIPTIWRMWTEPKCRKIPTIWKQWKFLCGSDRIVAWKFLQSEGCELNQSVGKFLRFEKSESFDLDWTKLKENSYDLKQENSYNLKDVNWTKV